MSTPRKTSKTSKTETTSTTQDYESVEQILASQERPMSMSDIRDAYYAAGARKAKARKDRDVDSFHFYSDLAREYLAQLPVAAVDDDTPADRCDLCDACRECGLSDRCKAHVDYSDYPD